ncbi:hypothetical protein F5148DRAFT_108863 [Russula earlei]|uniref:Uncharacterized protein n=1 Tax=Russula earlei TaxID=71964 RepID=A0ACC0U7N8_9AGAM|nr:hypothetical protein F5148DRAFT_108863 [Russula earlei]
MICERPPTHVRTNSPSITPNYTMGTQLLQLPSELLVLVFVLLPLRSIIACKCSCQHLRAVIKRSGLLRCRIRTMKTYIEDLSPPGLSTSDFLDHLRKWEKAWLTFSVGKEAATHTMFRPFEVQSKFLLRSGYLIQVCQRERLGWSYMDLSLRQDFREQTSASQWTDIQLEAGVSTGGWALDVDQNLIVVSLLSRETRRKRLEIRLMHFTTGTRHESAAIPAIELEFEGNYDRSFGTHIEVMVGHLVVLFAHGSLLRKYQSLYLVDWARGHILHRQRTRADTFFPVLTSISEDTLVLGRKREWALELCKITKEDNTLTFCTLCILKLPAVHPKAHTGLTNFNRTSSATTPSFSLKRQSTLPFRSSPADTVLSFAVSVRRGGKSLAEIKTLFFYALPNTLRKLAERVVAQCPRKLDRNNSMHDNTSSWLHRHGQRAPANTSIIMPWEDWGPETTRWINSSGLSGRQALSGMRCAVSEWSGRGVRLLDFNPERLRHVVAVHETGKGAVRVVQRLSVTSPSTIRAGRCFLRDFQSNLPYSELRRTGVKGDLLMDDEWIAQIQYKGISEPGQSIMVYSVVGTSS